MKLVHSRTYCSKPPLPSGGNICSIKLEHIFWRFNSQMHIRKCPGPKSKAGGLLPPSSLFLHENISNLFRFLYLELWTTQPRCRWGGRTSGRGTRCRWRTRSARCLKRKGWTPRRSRFGSCIWNEKCEDILDVQPSVIGYLKRKIGRCLNIMWTELWR